jgi:fluoroacetyl-CoA thioesterase
MDKTSLKVGLTAVVETVVVNRDTAKKHGSGSLDVLATPAMVALMEKAALSAVQLHLPPGCTTVGTLVNIRHVSATPVGMKVKAIAELVSFEDRKLVFKVEAFDDIEKIGEGNHERFVVSTDKFRSKVYTKKMVEP